MTADTGDVDINADVTGTDSVTASAGTDVTIAALVTGGTIDITATSGDVLFDGAAGALSSDDVVTVTAGSAIANTASTATTITTTGAGSNVTLNPTDISNVSTNTFIVDSSGSFELTGPMSGTSFTVDSVDTLTIAGKLTSQTGNIEVTSDNQSVLATDNIIASNGSVYLTAAGQLTVAYVEARSSGGIGDGDVYLTTTVGGDVKVDDIIADNKITIDSAGSIEENSDLDPDLTASSLVLDAVSGIGGGIGSEIETSADTLDATVSSAGDIDIAEYDAIELVDIDTFDGDIRISAGGQMTAADCTSSAKMRQICL